MALRLGAAFAGWCHGHGATPGRTLDQPVGHQPLQRPAHGDPGDAEVLHQMHLAGHAIHEAAFGQLFA